MQLDAEVHTLVWPNGADFDPATLDDWPLLHSELVARAQRWATVRKEFVAALEEAAKSLDAATDAEVTVLSCYDNM